MNYCENVENFPSSRLRSCSSVSTSSLVITSREFDLLFGRPEPDDRRIRGLVDKRRVDVSSVTALLWYCLRAEGQQLAVDKPMENNAPHVVKARTTPGPTWPTLPTTNFISNWLRWTSSGRNPLCFGLTQLQTLLLDTIWGVALPCSCTTGTSRPPASS